MNEPYQPIACSLHDKYELAIMHKRCITIRWVDDDGEPATARVIPENILVKNKEEFLIASTQENKALAIRLDRITLLE